MAAVPSRAILVEASDEHAEAAEIRVEAIPDANERLFKRQQYRHSHVLILQNNGESIGETRLNDKSKNEIQTRRSCKLLLVVFAPSPSYRCTNQSS